MKTPTKELLKKKIKSLEHTKSHFTKTTDKLYENQFEMMNKINEIIDFLNVNKKLK